MPLYDYECEDCGAKREKLFKVDEKPDKIECLCCFSTMGSIIILGHGGFHTDTPTWIDNDLRDALQGDDEAPIRSRSEYNQLLKDKKIEPIETDYRGRTMV